MRAFVIEGPGSGAVRNVPEPVAAATEAVVEVDTVGLCGTDVELFEGTMPYYRDGLASYPLRPGHEWAGTVREVGADVTTVRPGDRVTCDTFLGCGRCARCRAHRHYLCEWRQELGVRGGRPGALAEQVAVPASALHKIPAKLSFAAAAFVEPGSCALRGVTVADVHPGASTLVWGTGNLGLMAAQFARVLGAAVCVVGKVPRQRTLAAQLGFDDVVSPAGLGKRQFDCVIEATGSTSVPGQAVRRVAPGGRVALLGVAPATASLDAGYLVLNDITVIGVLGGSALIDEVIALLAGGDVDVEPLIAATVGLDAVAAVLSSGGRVPGTAAPKVHVQPSRES